MSSARVELAAVVINGTLCAVGGCVAAGAGSDPALCATVECYSGSMHGGMHGNMHIFGIFRTLNLF